MGFTQYGPGLLWKNGRESNAGRRIRHVSSGSILDAPAGRNQNASGSDPACLLGQYILSANGDQTALAELNFAINRVPLRDLTIVHMGTAGHQSISHHPPRYALELPIVNTLSNSITPLTLSSLSLRTLYDVIGGAFPNYVTCDVL